LRQAIVELGKANRPLGPHLERVDRILSEMQRALRS